MYKEIRCKSLDSPIGLTDRQRSNISDKSRDAWVDKPERHSRVPDLASISFS